MEKLIGWWNDHDPREQMILGSVTAAFAAFLFYWFAVSPVQEWRSNEQRRLLSAEDQVVEVQQLAAQLKAKKSTGSATSSNQNLAVLIDDSLRKNQLVMRGFTPGPNNDARLRLENAAYSALMQWLYDLEYVHGISVEDLSLTPASAPGYLMVSVRVSQ